MKTNKIHNEDCLMVFSRLKSNSVDLIIADPPYNLGKDFGNKSDVWENVEDWMEWSKKWIVESKRVLKPSGSLFVYGIHRYICYVQCYLYEIGMLYGRQFIWHYENAWNKYRRAPAATYEPILWFTKTKHYYYKEMREPYKSLERLKYKITKNGKSWLPNPDGKISGDVWKIPVLAGKRFANEKVAHPTQKPLRLCERIVKYFCPEGGLLLVPFAGSGSECVAAKTNNREFLGAELNENYIAIADKRLKACKEEAAIPAVELCLKKNSKQSFLAL